MLRCVYRMDHCGVIKVGDFGLTQDIYDTNYYRRRKNEASNERVPIRWMAPESIEEDVYDEKTDVVCLLQLWVLHLAEHVLRCMLQ